MTVSGSNNVKHWHIIAIGFVRRIENVYVVESFEESQRALLNEHEIEELVFLGAGCIWPTAIDDIAVYIILVRRVGRERFCRHDWFEVLIGVAQSLYECMERFLTIQLQPPVSSQDVRDIFSVYL